MTWNELKKKALKIYYPALFFERLIRHSLRMRIYAFIKIITLLLFLLALTLLGLSHTGQYPTADPYVSIAIGVFLISFAVWSMAAALQAFYYSYYFRSIPDNATTKAPMVTFELAHVLYRTHSKDLLSGFLRTHEGRFVLRRSGILASTFQAYFTTRKNFVTAEAVTFPNAAQITFTDYAAVLFDADKEFSQFLFAHGIQKKEFLAICDWVVERETAKKLKERWWSRGHLARIPGIGKAWSYGRIPAVEKYSRGLPYIASTEYETHTIYGSKELKQIEDVLIRTHEANIFFVGDSLEGKLAIIARLDRMIESGTAFPQIEHKNIILLDTDILLASAKTKNEFELELMKVMSEAAIAGNIILVFPDFPAFMASAATLGSDIVSLLDVYFTSPELQIIGLSSTDRFHAVIERNSSLMQRFDKVFLEETDVSNTIRVLENEIIPIEERAKIIFTYQSLSALSEAAERYVASGVMPDKAVTLLYEIIPAVIAQGKKVVRADDVMKLVTKKTGIPTGAVSGEEKEKLLNLEDILHHRIIGQDEAVSAIANAVRRARSGINSPNKPLASFLFLGPTGVGKTESTKALAEVFFGAEAKIERLDMSEYSGFDAVSKLIGSSDNNASGILSDMLREQPYGVLLLDEFEKTTKEVMNLFLQILDEGFFSDGSGKKVNARNLLIIATSNAGSDLIWEAVKKGNDLSHARDLIIDSLIEAKIFKPELLNRFDGVIIFHPLTNNNLEKIARIQLEGLKKRLAERGTNLAVTDDLVKYVTAFGTDPKFGARPMNRAIQDKVEQVIAEKLIRGDATPGSEIVISTTDLH